MKSGLLLFLVLVAFFLFACDNGQTAGGGQQPKSSSSGAPQNTPNDDVGSYAVLPSNANGQKNQRDV